jgi:hypothetical protein
MMFETAVKYYFSGGFVIYALEDKGFVLLCDLLASRFSEY